MKHFREISVHWTLSIRKESCWLDRLLCQESRPTRFGTKVGATVYCVTWKRFKNYLQEFTVILTHNNVTGFSRGSIEVVHEYSIETTWFNGLGLQLWTEAAKIKPAILSLTSCVTLRKWFNLSVPDFLI